MPVFLVHLVLFEWQYLVFETVSFSFKFKIQSTLDIPSLITQSIVSKNTVRTFSYLYFNSCHLKLLISQSKFSGTREFTLRYQQFEMYLQFEISRVGYISVPFLFCHFTKK